MDGINQLDHYLLILEVELYFDQVFHANLVRVVHDKFVVVECVAIRIFHSRLDQFTKGYRRAVRSEIMRQIH